MKHGFIKVGTATPKVTLADPSANLEEILRLHKDADALGVKLLVFPELCLTGYTCSDLFFSSVLLDAAKFALENFLAKTKNSSTISIIGFPLVVNDKLYNSAAICQNGQILGIVPKTHLPNYSEFSEGRYFSVYEGDTVEIELFGQSVPFGTKQIFSCSNFTPFRFGVEICEDLWTATPPSTTLAEAGALIIANLSASPEIIGKDARRRMLVESQSARTLCGYLYADCGDGESTTDLVFGGHSMIAQLGKIVAERTAFADGEALLVTELDLAHIEGERKRINTFTSVLSANIKNNRFSVEYTETELTRKIDSAPFIPSNKEELARRAETILTIQAKGLAQRVVRSYAKKCVIGISGGLDSTLAILVATKAMDLLGRPHSDVLGITMPCFGTTKRTRSNAEILCVELGTGLECIDISASVRQHFADLGHNEADHSVVYENAQARERTQLLMDIANRENGLVVGTGDLSELALGWATYNGDHMSMYGVNADVPKTLIRHVIAYCADNADKNGASRLAEVLRDILDTPVSPELLPSDEHGNIAQKTEDLVGPYEIHDFYLYHMLRFGDSPDKLYRLAKIAFDGKYSDEVLLKWLKNFVRRFFAQQFKRSCLPDAPKIGSVGFSPRGDWQMPSDAMATAWIKITEDLR
ncbi:MAG: NAD(+) synthase [Clostridia bacterium]|nr:NAD(+) synthase [Clostridia bacterium]